MNARTITAAVLGGSILLVLARPAHADTSAALGVSVSAHAPMVQADLELDRTVGFQAALGPFNDHLNGSLGARFHFAREKVTPYIGGLFVSRSHDNHHSVYEYGHEERLVGPTLGLRFREREGLGAFVQLELLRHVGDDDTHHHDHDGHDFHAFLGGGVQWWF